MKRKLSGNLFICMYAYKKNHIAQHVGARGLPQESFSGALISSFEQGLTLAWNSSIMLYWLPRQPQPSHRVCLSIMSPSCVLPTMTHIFTQDFGVNLTFLLLTEQIFSFPPIPDKIIFSHKLFSLAVNMPWTESFPFLIKTFLFIFSTNPSFPSLSFSHPCTSPYLISPPTP